MKKATPILLCFLFIFSCKEEVTLNFSEVSFLEENEAVVEINIPKAKGNTQTAKTINNTLSTFVNKALNIDASVEIKPSIKENIKAFNTSYKTFKTQIDEVLSQELPQWEALIDGEISYQGELLVSIAMSSSVNTGGANSPLVFKFFNFNTKTGKVLETKELFNDIEAFKVLTQKYLRKELLTTVKNDVTIENDSIKIPDLIGFSDDGVIVIYNKDTLHLDAPLEFIIPYEVANKYLNF